MNDKPATQRFDSLNFPRVIPESDSAATRSRCCGPMLSQGAEPPAAMTVESSLCHGFEVGSAPARQAPFRKVPVLKSIAV